jgi:hypothetical protein
MGGGRKAAVLRGLPNLKVKVQPEQTALAVRHSEQYEVKNRLGKVLNNTLYHLETAEGLQISGRTDDKGLTERVETNAPEAVKIWTGGAAEENLEALKHE